MAKAKTLTNTLYQLLAKFISTFSTLLITVIITRGLGVSIWGEYAVASSYIGFFYVFTEFGINSIAVKHFSERGKITVSEFLNFFIIRLLYTFVVILVAYTFLPLFNYSQNINQTIHILLFALLFFSISSSFNAIYQTKFLYKYLFYTTFLLGTVNLLFFIIVIFILNAHSLPYLAISLVLAELGRALLSIYLSTRLLEKDSGFEFDIILFKKFVKASLPLGIAIGFNTLMTQVDKLMLSVMVSIRDVGYYTLSYKLFDIVLVLPTFFMNAFFPTLVTKFKDFNQYNNLYIKGYVLMGLISLFITFIGFILSPIFIPIIWGVEMVPSIIVFQILILSSILFFLSSPVSYVFVIENKQHLLIYFYLIGFIFNFLLNLYLIPIWGYLGSAFSTGLTETLILIMLEWYRIKHLKTKYYYRKTLSYIKQIL